MGEERERERVGGGERGTAGGKRAGAYESVYCSSEGEGGSR